MYTRYELNKLVVRHIKTDMISFIECLFRLTKSRLLFLCNYYYTKYIHL